MQIEISVHRQGGSGGGAPSGSYGAPAQPSSNYGAPSNSGGQSYASNGGYQY